MREFNVFGILDDLIKSGEGEGSRGGTIVGHTSSGKPIYKNAKNAAHKDFSKEDHLDAIHAHNGARERLSGEYHAQRNSDGTVSKKHIQNRKRLEKESVFHMEQAARHREKYEPSSRTPDQRDFDRMDRKNDPKFIKSMSKR